MEIAILCIKIFFVRIIDVSIGTIRTIVTVKGKTFVSSVMSFFEVLIWFLIVREALNTDIDSIWIAIAYSGGYATGTYIGGFLSERFIKGNFGVQVITTNKELSNIIKKSGFGLSKIDISDDENEKFMLLIEIDKARFNKLKNVIKKYDKNAFVVVNETKDVYNGYFEK